MFVGQTRFSLFQPGSKAWRATSATQIDGRDEYRRYLYSDERMELRGKVFLEHSLPTIIRAAKRHEIYHVISISESLPSKYRHILDDFAKKYDCIVLDVRADGLGPSDWRALVDPKIQVGETLGVYRLDDDDLLGDDFFDRMQSFIATPFVGMRVSFGLVAQILYHDGKFSMPRESYHPMLGIGLMDVVQKRSELDYIVPKTISHNRSDRVGPVILDSTSIGSLWIRSVNQDTAFGDDRGSKLKQLKEHLKSLKQVDQAIFNKKFPSLNTSVDFGTQTTLLEQNVTVDESKTFNLLEPVENIDFSFTYEGAAGLQKSDYVWSFGLRDATTMAPILGIAIEGLTLASNRGLGYYRYARAQSGKGVGRVYLRLPDGVVCHQIQISAHRSSAPKLELSEIIVHSD